MSSALRRWKALWRGHFGSYLLKSTIKLDDRTVRSFLSSHDCWTLPIDSSWSVGPVWIYWGGHFLILNFAVYSTDVGFLQIRGTFFFNYFF